MPVSATTLQRYALPVRYACTSLLSNVEQIAVLQITINDCSISRAKRVGFLHLQSVAYQRYDHIYFRNCIEHLAQIFPKKCWRTKNTVLDFGFSSVVFTRARDVIQLGILVRAFPCDSFSYRSSTFALFTRCVLRHR